MIFLYITEMGIFKSRSKSKITLTVEGMTCEHCETKVRHALDGVEGVKMVTKVDRENNQAIVDIADREKATNEMLIKAISDAGYTGKENPGQA
jgi:copper chaperone